MSLPGFRTERLALVVAATELLQGLLIYALPGAFAAPAYNPIRPFFAQVATLFLAGGVLLFLLYRYRAPLVWHRALSFLSAAPMALLTWIFSGTQLWTGIVLYGVMAAGVLIAPWLPRGQQEHAVDFGVLSFGLIAFLIGSGMILYPAAFADSAYRVAHGWLWLLGAVGLLTGLLLSLSQLSPGLRGYPRITMLGALFPAMLLGVLLQTRMWTSLVWGVWSGSFLIAEAWRRRAGDREAATQVRDEQVPLLQMEQRLEVWTWVLGLAVVFLTAVSDFQVVANPARAIFFVVALSLYNIGTYLMPLSSEPSARVLIHLFFIALAVGALLVGSGPLGPILLTVLVVGVPLATRAGGRIAGWWMMAITMLVVPVDELYAWLSGTVTWQVALGALVMEWVVVGVASWLGLTQSLSELGLLQELRQSKAEMLRQYEELHETHRQLQSTYEELAAQEEELQEVNLALRRSESRFATILSIAPNAILAIDLQQRILLFNQQAEQIFGYTQEEALGQPLGLLLPPRFAAAHGRHVAQFAAEMTMARPMGERRGLTGRRKTGEEFPVEVAIAKSEVGTETYQIAILQDVTERYEAEQTRRESEERFRSAFNNAPIGMAILGPDGRWLRVNQALTRMLGYSEAEMATTTVEALTYGENRAEEICPLSAASPVQGGFFEVERRFRHKDGRVVWVQQSCTRMEDVRQGHYFIAHFQDVTERKEYEARLLQLANIDPLTELYNRRRFQEELGSYLALARKNRVRGAVLFLDLDLFKYVNDTLGHRAGDEVLRQVAALLKRELRPTDIAARHGGDEFAILMPYTGREAVEVAESILQGLQGEPFTAGGRSVTITASIGITFFPDNGLSAEELLTQADLAMYKAKELGRNAVAVYDSEDEWRTQMQSKLSWDRRLREALRQNRFILHAQPILDLHSGRITRLELLLRLVGENGELISPGAFLGGAERFGLIQEIDRWVVREAIRLMASLRSRCDVEAFEVNLSGKTISDPGLLRLLQEELAATGVDPACLVLEITETAAISDLEQVRRFIKAMRGLGCRFALDDVGSGFSTLHLLKHLEVDYLKIDGAFIRNLPTEPVDQHLVRALVAVAQSQGQKTIAEFVDSEETLRLLREFGVDYAQGYLVGRPGLEWLTH